MKPVFSKNQLYILFRNLDPSRKTASIIEIRPVKTGFILYKIPKFWYTSWILRICIFLVSRSKFFNFSFYLKDNFIKKKYIVFGNVFFSSDLFSAFYFFARISKFWSKIEILALKTKFGLKIGIFAPKSKF